MNEAIFRVIPPGDLAALALFCGLWLGYTALLRQLGMRAINLGLDSVRVLWMRSMILRDNRVTDAALIGHVVTSASFFASTSLIAIGALIGVLTGIERLEAAIAPLLMVTATSRALLELKVLLIVLVLVHGLFQLTWALRQVNYVVAFIGAIPPLPKGDVEPIAEQVGGMLSSAIATFNSGIRSYYFALAGLSWLAGPVALALAASGLMAVLVHRQYFSQVSLRVATARVLLERLHRD